MKHTILALTIICMLLFAGCASQAIVEETAEEITKENPADALILDFTAQLESMNVLIEPALDYEANTKSKAMLDNALKKLSQLKTETAELDKKLEEIKKEDFEGKDEFVPVFTELIGIFEGICEKYSEIYSYHLKMNEQESLEQKKSKMEDLHNAFVNCRCAEVDCESYKDSTLEFLEGSIEIFSDIRDSYGLESFGQVVETWTMEKDISEEYWPGLIGKSERYEKRCWDINDDYNEYLAEFDKIPGITENEIEDEITEKWMIPMQELVERMGRLSIRMDNMEQVMSK